ncbi:TetR/AcrR family transcriptional regulator [Variovorax sp. RHLX14]|uniref:TetR/AcrR family transcriptional regulator n=1 Tax=Variovorax sp. RHLX14 TaxID=1259731 RepID=UPI003F45691C
MARAPKTIGKVARHDRSEHPAEPALRSYHHGDLRAALLAAAEEELVETDLAGFSLRGTARRAQVSHAAPAHHFANTDALLSALAETGFARLADRMRLDMQAVSDVPRQRLAAAGRAYIAFAQAHPQLFRLMFSGRRSRRLADPCTDGTAAGSASASAFLLLRSCVEAVLDPAASEATIAAGITASWGLVHGISHLLIEDAIGFLVPLDAGQRQAVIDDAIDRLVAAFDVLQPAPDAAGRHRA